MFSGIQELLLIIVILLAIFFVPRMMGRYRASGPGKPKTALSRVHLSGRLRLALLVSMLWPLGAAIYLRPWHAPLEPFLYYGVGPVLLFWGIIWVIVGFSENRNK